MRIVRRRGWKDERGVRGWEERRGNDGSGEEKRYSESAARARVYNRTL